MIFICISSDGARVRIEADAVMSAAEDAYRSPLLLVTESPEGEPDAIVARIPPFWLVMTEESERRSGH